MLLLVKRESNVFLDDCFMYHLSPSLSHSLHHSLVVSLFILLFPFLVVRPNLSVFLKPWLYIPLCFCVLSVSVFITSSLLFFCIRSFYLFSTVWVEPYMLLMVGSECIVFWFQRQRNTWHLTFNYCYLQYQLFVLFLDNKKSCTFII